MTAPLIATFLNIISPIHKRRQLTIANQATRLSLAILYITGYNLIKRTDATNQSIESILFYRKKGEPMQSITIKRGFSVTPLLDIENAEFAHWYELGEWWAMYGDEQGKGAYRDRYIIDVLHHGILSHWFDSVTSGWFPFVGFNIGMLHGGMLNPCTHEVRPYGELVIITNFEG